MSKLVLIRHGESQWNFENRFTGWVDVPLSVQGIKEAASAGEKLKNYKFDIGYCSKLKRAIDTINIILERIGQTIIPIDYDSALNERHYGDLQGLDKTETVKKFGKDQVHLWRRSYDVAPPNGESLKDTAARVLPYWRFKIFPDIKMGKEILVVAHGNSLRSLVMILDNMTKDQIIELNIPTGVPIVYDFYEEKIVSKKYL